MAKDVHLLIVEDDEDHLFLVRKALKDGGFANPVHSFSDGESLLDFLRNPLTDADAGPFCILLDLGLPGMSGLDVLRAVKNSDDLRSIPVIILSSYAQTEVIAQCHDLGCNHFIPKPLDPVTFRRVIGQLGFFVQLIEIPIARKKA